MMTKDEFLAMINDPVEEEKQMIQLSLSALLVLSDEEFIDIWTNGSDIFKFNIPSGKIVVDKIYERVEKLGLKKKYHPYEPKNPAHPNISHYNK